MENLATEKNQFKLESVCKCGIDCSVKETSRSKDGLEITMISGQIVAFKEFCVPADLKLIDPDTATAVKVDGVAKCCEK